MDQHDKNRFKDGMQTSGDGDFTLSSDGFGTFLRKLLATSLDPMIAWNESGTYLDVNLPARSVLDLDDSLAHTAFAMPGSMVGTLLQSISSQLKTSESAYGIQVVSNSDRQQREIGFRATANMLPGIHIATLHDVTERRKSSSQDACHRQFVQMAREGFWMADRQWCTAMVNPRLCELLGYKEADMLGKHVMEFYFPEDREEALAHLSAREQGEENRYVVRYRRVDGSELWAEISVKPMFDNAGQFDGAIALLIDVGDKLAAERELCATRELVRTAAEVLGLGFWDADIETRRMVWTRELQILFGFTPGSYDGTFESFYERIHPDDREPVRAAYQRAIETGETYNFDYRVPSADGGWHWIGARGRVIVGPDGRPGRSVGVAVSIDEYKKLEAQLLQSQRLESLGRLVSSVAHDFNNLLIAICGFTELAQTSIDPDGEAAAYLKHVEDAGTRATELVKQLLTFACHRGGAPQSINLSKFTIGLRGILSTLVGDDVELVINVEDADLSVRIDPVQFEQVIVNLVVNAGDAMPEGGTLTISLGPRWGDRLEDEFVIVTVEDSGVGMDAATKERIFDPFFTTKEIGKGTGLGLSTCYGIVKSADGQIIVSSEPGLGSKFEILFPRALPATLQVCA